MRQLLIEASGGICKGAVGHKSKDLRARQNGNTAEVIAYADKANTRLRSRYYKFIRHGKKCGSSCNSKRTGMFCMGHDDR